MDLLEIPSYDIFIFRLLDGTSKNLNIGKTKIKGK
jgi:hypothetical protein